MHGRITADDQVASTWSTWSRPANHGPGSSSARRPAAAPAAARPGDREHLVEHLVDGPRACLHVKTQTRPTRTNKHKHGPQQLRQQLGDQVARPANHGPGTANQATRCTDTGSTSRAPSGRDQGPGMPGELGAGVRPGRRAATRCATTWRDSTRCRSCDQAVGELRPGGRIPGEKKPGTGAGREGSRVRPGRG